MARAAPKFDTLGEVATSGHLRRAIPAMPQSIDELFARWHQRPTATDTAALCDALRGTGRHELVELVGAHAVRAGELGGLLAAGRMYLDADRLDDAQAALVAAGRVAPREPEVYRWLGEVLLRRGDAERAEKVFERALQFGAVEAVARPRLERARALGPLQQSGGPAAVLAELARANVPAAPLPDLTSAAQNRSSLTDDDLETLVRREPTRGAFEDLVFTGPPRSLGFDLSGGPPTRAPVAHAHEPASAATATFASREPPSSKREPPSSQRSAGLAPPPPPVNPLLLEPLGGASAGRDTAIPEARDVLEALQIAGVYEPEGTSLPPVFSWAKPERARRLISVVTLVGLALALVGGGAGTYVYVNKRRARDHVEAERLLAKVDKDLSESAVRLLDPAEKAISRSFELESRSPHAALTWLRERVLVGVLRGGADLAFEDATARAKAVGVPDKDVAFAHVASFLFQGDTAGAAGTVAKWDAAAQGDAWFQLVAAATFERAGDPRAVERYAAAVRLAPELVVAQMQLTRATAFADPRRAGELAREFRIRHPARAEGAALIALAWSSDPTRGDAPVEIDEVTERGGDLPSGLKSVPYATRAILALRRGAVEEARPALQRGLDLADTPGVAAWLGNIALGTGDEALARKAALTALAFSAAYPPARVLAARVALLGARLDEALKAAEDLPATSADAAVVTMAVSYERLDAERMGRAFDAVPEEARALSFVQPLAAGRMLLGGDLGVLTGDKAAAMSRDDAPWADLVAMDWALDAGDLDAAKKISEAWQGEPRAMRALRLARLARYDGRLDDADRLSTIAIDAGTVTLRALVERVFTLVAMKRDGDALALFKTYPNVGGPLTKWLRAYATAMHGKVDEARAILAQEDPPPAAAPMPVRLLAASAYAAMKDTRHGADVAKAIVKAGFASPDVAFAAERLGAGKVGAKKRR